MSRRRRSNRFGDRVERAAKAGAENGVVQGVFWLAGIAAFSGFVWLVNQFRNT